MLGAAVWALSPWLAGSREPWDADGAYWPLALAAAGLLAGLLAPRPAWAHYLGSILGQAAYEWLFLPIGPLFVMGVAFLMAYSIIFVVAAALGGRLRRLCSPHAGPA